MPDEPPKRRSNRLLRRISVRVAPRTYKQWRKCLAIARIGGLRNDQLMAKMIRLATVRMQQQCSDAGIDWRSALELHAGDDDCPDITEESDSRKPMISE